MKPKTIYTNYRNLTLKAIDLHFSDFILGLFTTFFLFAFLVYATNALSIFRHVATYKKTVKLQATKQRTYQVKEGDDLWGIAQAQYGSGYNAIDIAQANHLVDPSGISPGQMLIIPPVLSKQPTVGEITEQAASAGPVTFNGGKYTVQEGESLSDIAQKAYGDNGMWVRIAKANNITNPDVVAAGTVLIIPR